MKKEIKIEVPNGYHAITLKKYLEMQDDMIAYADEPDAITASLFWHLCGMTPELLTAMDVNTYTKIKEQLFEFIGKTNWELQQFITIDGVEYGFEPNLSEMTYGAYVDISKYQDLSINHDWKNVMNILYRPVKKKSIKMYEIETYTGDSDSDKWLDVTMDIHFGALFFFINLSKDLLSATLKSLTTKADIPPNIKHVLLQSGEAIQQYMNLQEEIFSDLMQS
jgi:hypothetical protein